ncbi:hypothetical protein D3C85_1639750 [compost metagenome]
MTVGDDQQQGTFAPRGDMAMLPGSRLQLAVEQLLQLRQALGLAEQGFERPGFAQKNSGGAGWRGAKSHEGTPEVTELPS